MRDMVPRVGRMVLGALVALLPTFAFAADLAGEARVSVGSGVDTNARRDATPVGPVTDAVGSATGSVEGSATFDSARLQGGYDLGGRKFVFYPSEDVLVQNGFGEASMAVGRYLGIGLSGRARDRRGGSRDYTDLAGNAFLEYVPDAALDLRVWAGGHRFIYWPSFGYSFGATELGGTGRYRFNRQHSVVVFGEAGFRTYNSMALANPALEEPPPPQRRADTVFTAGAGYAFKGRWFSLSPSYAYVDQTSNSHAESARRHRLTLTGAVRLPWKFYLLGQVSRVFSSYPQGFRLSPEDVLDEDAENANSISARLVRPLTSSLDLEARFSHYDNHLPSFDYGRELYWLGITWRH